MQIRRGALVFVAAGALGFGLAVRASPACEPLALDLAVTSVVVSNVVATSPSTKFLLRDLGAGNYGGTLFDPDTKTRVLSLAMTP